jgi:hypothetical protein
MTGTSLVSALEGTIVRSIGRRSPAVAAAPARRAAHQHRRYGWRAARSDDVRPTDG